MIGKVVAAAGALVVVAGTAAAIAVNRGDDDGSTGYLEDPLTIGAKAIVADFDGVALPADRPDELSMLFAVSGSGVFEGHFTTRSQSISICQGADLTGSTCDQDEAALIHEEATDDGQTWQVVRMSDEIQDGTPAAKEAVSWWTDVPYTSTTPEWITELAKLEHSF